MSAPAKVRLPAEIWVLIAAAFVIAVGFGLVAPVLPQYAREFGVGIAAASAIVSAFALMRLLFAPASGRLVQKLGERRVYLAGIVIVGRSGVANPSAAMSGNYETDAIAACIIGGASFTGGKGTVWGTLIGCLIIAVIRNGLTLMNAQSDVQFMVIGAVIIVAVFIDVRRTASEERRRRLAAA